ncbi:MAG: amino acid adenylation domain-containing protein [Chromatiales bacterium]|nr:amino acid adenylation domain-containing protein [Chromatiales bacterium]
MRDLEPASDASSRREQLRRLLQAEVERHPLSVQQERVWLVEQLGACGPAYHVVRAYRLDGPVDPAALQTALARLVGRHEVLRTAFESEDGRPSQRVLDAVALDLPVEDLSVLGADARDAALAALLADQSRAPFDLGRGEVFRARLVRLAPEHHVLSLAMHHLVSDGWSLGIIARDLTELYRAAVRGDSPVLAPLPIQYADYASWQREALTDASMVDSLAYWRKHLAGVSPLPLPADRRRPTVQTFNGAHARVHLPRALVEATAGYGRGRDATVFMVLLAAFAALLHRYACEDDVCIGSPVANRERREVEDLVGFFANILVLRLDLGGEPSFDALVARAREVVLGAFEHQDVPFERLVHELAPTRDSARNPLFQVAFALQSAPMDAPVSDGLALTPINPVPMDPRASRFDLEVHVFYVEDGADAWFVYNTDLFDAASIERMMLHYRALLEAALAAPERPVGRIPLMSAGERARWVEVAQRSVTDYPREATVVELFDAEASRRPDATAVVCGDERLTYAELARAANRMAAFLGMRGVGVGDRVGFCLRRSVDAVVTMLGVLKAGAAYVPLDPDHPGDRNVFVLSDTAAALAVTTRDLAPRLAGAAVDSVVLEDVRDLIASADDSGRALAAGAQSLAYVMYTSGSTGEPKGVSVTHRGIVRLVRGANYVTLDQEQVIAQFAPLAFDAATFEIWGALLNGGKLVVVPFGPEGLDRLGEVIRRERVTTLWLTAALFNGMVGERTAELGGVRQLLAGGEALSTPHVAKALDAWPRTTIVNGYGPTENTTFTCCHRIDRADLDRPGIPIGYPVSNTWAYVLDAAGQPVPDGVPGELWAGGDGVAEGYWNRPELTAERFVPDPFSSRPGARMYRTGDRVRRGTGGWLEFLGRFDDQVKIRGFRVELGEIEAALERERTVRAAVVLCREDEPGDKRLVAYVVLDGARAVPLDGDADQAVKALRATLERRLPRYMVPSAFVLMDALPLNANGKVDRRSLPAPPAPGADAGARRAPRSETERRLAEIWTAVLRADEIGIDDDFFELGGHSLLATQVVSRIREAFGVDVSLAELFAEPTVEGLARRLGRSSPAEAQDDDEPRLGRIERPEAIPLSFPQGRLWFLHQLTPDSHAYNIPLALALRGRLDRDALSRALAALVERHEVLRTRFDGSGDQPRQVVVAEMTVPLAFADLGALPEPDRERRTQQLVRDAVTRPFDLQLGPPMRAELVRVEADYHLLLLTLHHIAGDGWSLGVLFRELGALYAGFAGGVAPALPELAVQYADFALWQRRRMSGARLRREMDYWLERLDGLPVLQLPTDRPRPPMLSARGDSVVRVMPSALEDALERLCRAEGATLFMTMLAGFAALLRRYSGQDELVVGSPIANRNHAEIEGLIGFFVNVMVLRIDAGGGPTFRELIGRVRECAVGAYDHQDVPFEALVDALEPERDPSRNPLFQVSFAVQNAPIEPLALPGLTLEPVPSDEHATRFDLEVQVWQTPDALTLITYYSPDLFERATVERMLAHFERLLEMMVAAPDESVDVGSLLAPLERAEILEQLSAASSTARVRAAREAGVLAAIAAQAERTPNATAVRAGARALTYRELVDMAGGVAERLRAEHGVVAGDRVGLLVDRSPELVAIILGVLDAGAAYVPIDPVYPDERIEYMVADSGCRLVVVDARHRSRVPADARTAEPASLVVAARPGLGLAPMPPERLAYIMYTSGSTGRPKGVAIDHRNLAHYLGWASTHYFGGDDPPAGSFPLYSSIAFDLTVTSVFVPLLRGATIHVFEQDASVAEVLEAVFRPGSGIDCVKLTPSHIALVAGLGLDRTDVRLAVVGGEQLAMKAVRALHALNPGMSVQNEYGPTEATVGCVVHEVTATDEVVLIGRPIDDTPVYVLDDRLELQPVGVPGEIWIGGDGVAGGGYWNRPDLTAERFRDDPFVGSDGPARARMYRTGDLARWRADGALELFGRLDHQVKLRGYRIELGEIESVLNEHPGVAESVVLCREDVADDRRLVAYVTPTSAWSAQRHEAHAAEHVAEWCTLYESTYGGADPTADPDLDLTGWGSSYTGKAIPVEEMREWVTETVDWIRSFRPRRLLEIGCGTGLLLGRVAPTCERYVGCDFSAAALARVGRLVQVREDLRHVELRQREASDFAGVEEGAFDTVLVNSVVQYLPSLQYLHDVLTRAVRAIGAGGRVLIGDVRSLPLLGAFHAAVQVARADDDVGAEDLRRRVEQQTDLEKELVIDPDFFRTFMAQEPRVRAVEILLKRGQSDNELTQFRYDVVLHVEPPVVPESVQWLAWDRQLGDLAALRRELAASSAATVAVRDIPNARVRGGVAMARTLAGDLSDLTTAGLREVGASARAAGIRPDALWALAAETDWSLELSYAASGDPGAMDALFRRGGREAAPGGVYFADARRVAARDGARLATNPLSARLAADLVPALGGHLEARVPEFMVPAAIFVLETMPLTANGKLDRRALPAPELSRLVLGGEYVAPRTEAEKSLAEIWRGVLRIDRVGVDDDFFDLGGHSLLATQVVGRLRAAFGVEVPLVAMFDHRTVERLASHLETLQWAARGRAARARTADGKRRGGAL